VDIGNITTTNKTNNFQLLKSKDDKY